MATKDRYTTSAHCIYNLGYHIIWCPKYRRKVLVDGIDERLKELLNEKAAALGITIEKMEVMPDHETCSWRETLSTFSVHSEPVKGLHLRDASSGVPRAKKPIPDALDEIVLRREYRSYFGVHDYKVYRGPEESLTKWEYVRFHPQPEGQGIPAWNS